jgi:chromosome segregation ATPase
MSSSLENYDSTQAELSRLMERLTQNPATRKNVLREVKKLEPDLPIPELEIEDSLRNVTNHAEARVQQLEARLREKEALEELQRRRQALVKKGKISDEAEIEEVEKIMLEKGIQNHDTAAEYYKWMREQAAPTPTAFNRNVLDTTARNSLQPFWKNPVTAARDEATKAFMEMRKNPRPIGL